MQPTSASDRPVLIWTIDPFESHYRASPEAARSLKKWADTIHLEIEFVHVSPPLSDELGSARVEQEVINDLVAAKERSVRDFLKRWGLDGIFNIKILFAASRSPQESVTALLQWAAIRSATCIVATAPSGSDLTRQLFGSFSEKLLSAANIPILFISETPVHETHSMEGKTALFATDYSDASFRAFHQFLPWARCFGMEVALFYSISIPAWALDGGLGGGVTISDDYFTDQLDWAKRHARDWIEVAQVSGVIARSSLDQNRVVSRTSQSILNAAFDQKAVMIVMGSTSSPMSALLLGSTAHQILESHRYPIWMYGPSALMFDGAKPSETVSPKDSKRSDPVRASRG